MTNTLKSTHDACKDYPLKTSLDSDQDSLRESAEDEECAGASGDASREEDGELEVQVRVDEMFTKMHPQRRLLMKIILFCETERSDSELFGKVQSLIENDYTIYPPDTLCSIMEKFGALRYTLPYDEEYEDSDEALYEHSNRIVAVDENTEMIVSQARVEGEEMKEGSWIAAPEALEYVQALKEDEVEQFYHTIESESNLKSAYAALLEYCLTRKRTKMDIDERIDAHPALQQPRVFSGHLVTAMERCGCLEWEKGWKTTEQGIKALEILREML